MDITDYKIFWRGEFGLGQAFWIMYFGINCALGFGVLLLMFVANIFHIQSLVIIIYFFGVVIIAAYTLWAAVGMWRCSPLRGKDGKGPILLWPVVVKIIIVLCSLSAISTLIDVVKHPEQMVTVTPAHR
jgi:hypothetical protein